LLPEMIRLLRCWRAWQPGITTNIDRPKLSPEDIEKLQSAMHANPASE
jgi:hypothetical protein